MIKVYSKENCTQCLQVESLLNMKGIKCEVLKLDTDYSRDDLNQILADLKHPPPRSFPVVISDDGFVGDLNAVKIAVVKGNIK